MLIWQWERIEGKKTTAVQIFLTNRDVSSCNEGRVTEKEILER